MRGDSSPGAESGLRELPQVHVGVKLNWGGGSLIMHCFLQKMEFSEITEMTYSTFS